MSRELVFLPELRQDFIEAFNYYEALSPGKKRWIKFLEAFSLTCDGHDAVAPRWQKPRAKPMK